MNKLDLDQSASGPCEDLHRSQVDSQDPRSESIVPMAVVGTLLAPWLAGPAVFLAGIGAIHALSHPDVGRLSKALICSCVAAFLWFVVPAVLGPMIADSGLEGPHIPLASITRLTAGGYAVMAFVFLVGSVVKSNRRTRPA